MLPLATFCKTIFEAISSKPRSGKLFSQIFLNGKGQKLHRAGSEKYGKWEGI
jgi:hypothetical protein